MGMKCGLLLCSAASLLAALPVAEAAGDEHAFDLGQSVTHNPVEPAIMLMGVLAISVLIERVTEMIEHHSSQYSALIIQKIYKEIMILGVISFVLVVVILQARPSGFSIPLFEFCHFLLFFMGIFFAIGCTYTASWISHRTKEWEDTENREHAIHAWRHQKSRDPGFEALQGSWRTPDGNVVEIDGETAVFDSGDQVEALAHSDGQIMLGGLKVTQASADTLYWSDKTTWMRNGPAPASARDLLDSKQQILLKLALAFRRDKEVILKGAWFQKHVRISQLEGETAKQHLRVLSRSPLPSPGSQSIRSIEELRRAVTLDPGGESALNFVHLRVGAWIGDDERKIAALALAARIDRLQYEIREREHFEMARRRREMPLRFRRHRRVFFSSQSDDEGSPMSAEPVQEMTGLTGTTKKGFSTVVHSHRYHPLEAGQQYEEIATTWDLLGTLLEHHIDTDVEFDPLTTTGVDDASSSGSSDDSARCAHLPHAASGLAAAAHPNFGDEQLRRLHVDAEHFEHTKVPFSSYRSRYTRNTLEQFLELKWQTWLMLLAGTGIHLLRAEVWERGETLPREGVDSWVFGVGYGVLAAVLLLALKLKVQFCTYYACMMQHEEMARAKLWLGLDVYEDRAGNLGAFPWVVRKLSVQLMRHVDRKMEAGVEVDPGRAFELFWSFGWDLILLQFISVCACVHLAHTILVYSPRMHDLYCGTEPPFDDGSSAPPREPTASMCELGWLWSVLVNIAALGPYLITFLFLVPPSLSALSDLTKLGANLDLKMLGQLEQVQEKSWKEKLEDDRAEAVLARLRRRFAAVVPASPASTCGDPEPFRRIVDRHDTDVWTGGRMRAPPSPGSPPLGEARRTSSLHPRKPKKARSVTSAHTPGEIVLQPLQSPNGGANGGPRTPPRSDLRTPAADALVPSYDGGTSQPTVQAHSPPPSPDTADVQPEQARAPY